MSRNAVAGELGRASRASRASYGGWLHRFLSAWGGRLVVTVTVVLWTLPTFGILVSSFRPEEDVRDSGWWTVLTDPGFTLENYRQVLVGGEGQAGNMWGHFLNSIAITVPATVVPIGIAAFAAYAFAWMRFPGRDWLFVGVVGLLVVPLQMALIPVLSAYTRGVRVFGVTLLPEVGLAGSLPGIWLAHTAFGMPLAVYLLRNYIGSLPRDLFEAAWADGASHFTVFRKLVLPLSVPALASFGIFQFLWVWNDYLVAVTFVGSAPDTAPMTVRLAELVGSRGQDQHLLTAGAFITMVVPLIVFFTLQRFFVRGLLAGSVKS